MNPVVQLLGDDAASIAYIRLTQTLDRMGICDTNKIAETRIWQRNANDKDKWLNVHVHRSTFNGAAPLTSMSQFNANLMHNNAMSGNTSGNNAAANNALIAQAFGVSNTLTASTHTPNGHL